MGDHGASASPSGLLAAAERWRQALAAWAIPERILDAATRSPWQHAVAGFAARADEEIAAPSGESYRLAAQALRSRRGGTAGGSVLDVGAGAGAAGLPLLASGVAAAGLTAVDPSAAMLAALTARADRLGRHVDAIEGRWPDVAGAAGVHDVVVCRHVAYDVPDLPPFLAALTRAARTAVVVELTERHPLCWLGPLWLRFHGLGRPQGPGAADFAEVVARSGVTGLVVVRWERLGRPPPPVDEQAALVARRLCLPPDREPEVAAALAELGLPPAGPRAVVTLRWDGTAAAGA